MSNQTTHLSESDLSSTKTLLRQMAQDLQSLQLRQLRYENRVIEDRRERDNHLAVLEELRII